MKTKGAIEGIHRRALEEIKQVVQQVPGTAETIKEMRGCGTEAEMVTRMMGTETVKGTMNPRRQPRTKSFTTTIKIISIAGGTTMVTIERETPCGNRSTTTMAMRGIRSGITSRGSSRRRRSRATRNLRKLHRAARKKSPSNRRRFHNASSSSRTSKATRWSV